jgi:uncharacterized protein
MESLPTTGPESTTALPEGLQPASPRSAIAPAWHTLLLAVALVGHSLLGFHTQHKFLSSHGHVMLYLVTMLWEWLMVGYVLLGIRIRKARLRDLIGGRWASPEDALIDVGLGAATCLGIYILLALLALPLGMLKNAGQTLQDSKQNLQFLAPGSGFELGVFLALCMTAAICEEIIFRGYFQRQFSAWGNSAVIGILVQAVLFGSSHGYEGSARMLMIAGEGVLLGAVAYWRKGLRPGMFAHFGQDAIAGIALRFLPR